MTSALASLLSRYTLATSEDYHKALREVVQHIALLGLWRSRFFDRAAFYGGTALRIFHGLSRYSEDLDFSLLAPDPDFQLDHFTPGIENELEAFGFSAAVEHKENSSTSRIDSAFIKAGTVQSMLNVNAPPSITDRLHREAVLKVKLEVDTNPPAFAQTDVSSLLLPMPFQVRLYTPSSLFAGKIHALLCRAWKTRVKGRDYYDFIWFVGMGIPCNLRHLQARMVQTGHLKDHEPLDRIKLRELLDIRFDTVNLNQAANDALPFVNDRQSLELWSADFFKEVAQRIAVE
jgi:hypothetical protein